MLKKKPESVQYHIKIYIYISLYTCTGRKKGPGKIKIIYKKNKQIKLQIIVLSGSEWRKVGTRIPIRIIIYSDPKHGFFSSLAKLLVLRSGFVRGQNLSANRLVHIPGLGDFQLAKVEKLEDPAPLARKQVLVERENNSGLPEPPIFDISGSERFPTFKHVMLT